MNDYGFNNYGIFSDAITTIQTVNNDMTTAKDTLTECKTKIADQSIFMGPAADECTSKMDVVNTKITTMVENFSTMGSFVNQAASDYKKTDEKAQETVSTNDTIEEKAGDKNIDTSSLISGTNVANAAEKYKDEIEKADYATVNGNLFSTTTTTTINGQQVKVTHVVINNGSQINGAPANGSYGNGLEKSSSAAQRLNSPLLVNGSHFSSDGTEDLKGANNIVIVNGEIKKDGTSGGNELLLDKNGNIYNASGKSAQELVNNGVKYSFSCHSTQVIENGDTSPSYRENRLYKRTVIGQSAPGEYYIVTDTNTNNKLSDTAEYLKSKGVQNAYSLDQGGSVTLVRDGQVINNPSDSTGERPVGDFLYFTV